MKTGINKKINQKAFIFSQNRKESQITNLKFKVAKIVVLPLLIVRFMKGKILIKLIKYIYCNYQKKIKNKEIFNQKIAYMMMVI